MQAMQKLTPQPQLPPEAQALKETSLAETQRRAQRDQAEMQLEGADMQQRGQIDVGAVQGDQQRAAERDQLDVALQDANERSRSAKILRIARRIKK